MINKGRVLLGRISDDAIRKLFELLLHEAVSADEARSIARSVLGQGASSADPRGEAPPPPIEEEGGDEGGDI